MRRGILPCDCWLSDGKALRWRGRSVRSNPRVVASLTVTAALGLVKLFAMAPPASGESGAFGAANAFVARPTARVAMSSAATASTAVAAAITASRGAAAAWAEEGEFWKMQDMAERARAVAEARSKVYIPGLELENGLPTESTIYFAVFSLVFNAIAIYFSFFSSFFNTRRNAEEVRQRNWDQGQMTANDLVKRLNEFGKD
mmetsp:Transcript_74691/g.207667  ORF Transcript_74691/g.207667 Transcript_74691/m.207667 type:complete len:201 (+) Transcript_74691:106-708(+)